jgi:hypothetical protein
VYLEPDDALDKPDDGPSFSSGGGVGLSERLDKPDAASGLKDRIGTGSLLCASGTSGQVEGVMAYAVEERPLFSISPSIIVMSVITVMTARKWLA